MQYSPRLKSAMAEIKAILEKYDIAGAVVIHEPGFAEYLLKVDPSYSLLKFEPIGSAFTVTVSTQNRTKSQIEQAISETCNMSRQLAHACSHVCISLMNMDEYMTEKYNPTHSSGGHTTHISQNN